MRLTLLIGLPFAVKRSFVEKWRKESGDVLLDRHAFGLLDNASLRHERRREVEDARIVEMCHSLFASGNPGVTVCGPMMGRDDRSYLLKDRGWERRILWVMTPKHVCQTRRRTEESLQMVWTHGSGSLDYPTPDEANTMLVAMDDSSPVIEAPAFMLA